mgnify:CR=1 FL=1
MRWSIPLRALEGFCDKLAVSDASFAIAIHSKPLVLTVAANVSFEWPHRSIRIAC